MAWPEPKILWEGTRIVRFWCANDINAASISVKMHNPHIISISNKHVALFGHKHTLRIIKCMNHTAIFKFTVDIQNSKTAVYPNNAVVPRIYYVKSVIRCCK